MFGIKSAKTCGQSPARQVRTDHREAVLHFSGRTGLVATEESGVVIMSGIRAMGSVQREEMYFLSHRTDKWEVLMANIMSD